MLFLRKPAPSFLLILATLLGSAPAVLGANEPEEQPHPVFSWEELPAIPDAAGLAGAFSGVSNGALLIAGGANFPGGMPWEGGAKAWHDEIYVLDSPEGAWRKAGTLPRPLAYGAALTVPGGVLCIGGGDRDRHYRDVFLMKWQNGGIDIEELPSLPEPRAFFCAARVDGRIYVAGGLSSPGAGKPVRSFWSLDLSEPAGSMKWRELPAWPGPARMLPVAGAQDGAFFLISGADLVPDDQGKPVRKFLTDAYRYDPGENAWRGIAGLPHPVVAAPSPAVTLGQAHLAVLGGDDGSNFFRQGELKDRHPGFNRQILAYHTITDTWAVMGQVGGDRDGLEGAAAPVTTAAVPWNGKIVIPSGEIRPGVRTPVVLAATPLQKRSGFAFPDIAVLIVYFIILIGIGVYYASRERTTNDYFLGGNRIPWWAAGLSIFGTQLSAITFMAIPAKTYATDWVFFLVNMTIVAVAPVVVYVYLPFFRRLKITSAYEYLEKRFSFAARMVGSLSFLLFQFGRMGIVLFLPALALNAVLDINIFVCILLMGGLSTTYTFLGGIEADIWNDVFQVILLLGGALLSLILIVNQTEGGVHTLIEQGMAAGKFRLVNWSWDATTDAVWVILVGSFFASMVSYTSDQAVVQRYLTTESKAEAARSIWTNAILTVPATIIFFSVGTALWVFYRTQPELLDPMSRSDDIFPWFIAQQLPPGVSGLVIAGIFAAAMSTLDSSINSMSAVITTDFFERLKPGASDKERLKVARYITLGLGVIGVGFAMYMALLRNASMWDQYFKVVGLFGGALAGMFAAGIFTRRVHGAGVITGFFTSAAVLFVVQSNTNIHFLLYAAIGMLTCFAVSYLASIIIPGKRGGAEFTIHTDDTGQ